ncbi:transposase [Streptomyces longispororuber]|uniref:transposase n=1 Tax=Streptomyces longispororuber TaxID=68230 RepID=UPI0034068414
MFLIRWPSACLLVGWVVGKRQSRPWLVSDGLCSLVEPLLSEPGPELVAGRARVPDRQVLCGILFVLHTGIPWEYPPQGLGSGSGRTCRRGLAAWNEAGVWDQLHVVLLKKLRTARQLHSSRAVIDSSPVRAARRDPEVVPARSSAHGRAASTTSSPTGRASHSCAGCRTRASPASRPSTPRCWR